MHLSLGYTLKMTVESLKRKPLELKSYDCFCEGTLNEGKVVGNWNLKKYFDLRFRRNLRI